jgi:hypothetical protein
LPKWRQHQVEAPAINKETHDALLKQLKRLENEALPLDPSTVVRSDATDYLLIQRKVYARKGKWKRFPPEVETIKT